MKDEYIHPYELAARKAYEAVAEIHKEPVAWEDLPTDMRARWRVIARAAVANFPGPIVLDVTITRPGMPGVPYCWKGSADTTKASVDAMLDDLHRMLLSVCTVTK